MANLKSSRKKIRQDFKKRQHNLAVKKSFKAQIKAYGKKPSQENLKKAVSLIDKAAKKRVIHKNKAARLKSRLSKIKH